MDDESVISVAITADAGSLNSTMSKATADVKASLATLEAAFKQANLEMKLAPHMDPQEAGKIKAQQQQLEYQVDFTKAMLGRLTLEWDRAALRVKAAQAEMAAGGSGSDMNEAIASQQAIAERMGRLQVGASSAAAGGGAAQTAAVEAGQSAQQAAILKTADVQADSSALQTDAVEAQTAAEIEATQSAAAVRQASDAVNTEAYLARATAQSAANKVRVAAAVEGEGAQAAAALKTTAATEATTAAAQKSGVATVEAMAAARASASSLALRLALLKEEHNQAASAVRSYAQESLKAAETAAALGRTGSAAAEEIAANFEVAVAKQRELAIAVEEAALALEKEDGVVRHLQGSMLNAQVAGQGLREVIGVGIPRGIERVMSQSPLMGMALQAAMPVFIGVMMAEILEKIVEKVMAWRDGLKDIKEYNETIGRDMDKQAEALQRLAKENKEADLKLIGVQHGPAAEESERAKYAKAQHETDQQAVHGAEINSLAATKRYQDATRLVREANAAAAKATATNASGPDLALSDYPKFAPPNPALDEAKKGLGIEGGLGGSATETEHNPLADSMRLAALTLQHAQEAAQLSGTNIAIDTGKESKDRSKEMAAKLKAADQEKLEDLKDNHELTIAEEIAFWEKRSHIQAGYLERDRAIRHTLAQLRQAEFKQEAAERTQAASASAEGMVRPDESADYAARAQAWAAKLALDKEGLANRTRLQSEVDNDAKELAKNSAASLSQIDEDRVKANKAAFDELLTIRRMSAVQEADYWYQIAFMADQGSKAQIAAIDAMIAAEKRIPQEKYDHDAGEIKGAQSSQAGALQDQAEQQRGSNALAPGGGSQDAQLQAQQALDAKLWQLQMNADAKLRALAQAAGKDTTDLDNKMVTDYEKGLKTMERDQLALDLRLKKNWDSMFAGINRDFTSTIDGMMKHQETFAQGMVKMWNNMVESMVNALLKVALEWAEQELLITVLHLTGLETREAADIAFSMKKRLWNAEDAAGSAYNSVVGIPIVGPVLAPIAAAVAFAAVMAFEQGGIVPGGSGASAALLHPNEMVLPAPLSQGFQKMLGAGGGGAGGNTHIHYSPTVHSYGAGGMEDMLKSHAATIHQIVKRGQRTGHLPG